MDAAREARVKFIGGGSGASDVLMFSNPAEGSPVFKYDQSDDTLMSSDPMLKDPYEARMAEVRESTIAKASFLTVIRAQFRKAISESDFYRPAKACLCFNPCPTTPSSPTSTVSI